MTDRRLTDTMVVCSTLLDELPAEQATIVIAALHGMYSKKFELQEYEKAQAQAYKSMSEHLGTAVSN